MNGRFYIGDIDIFATYGIFVEQYGYEELVQMPSFKTIEYNDWEEEDGIEADLSDPKLDTRNLTINFCATDIDMVTDFIYLLSSSVYHTCNMVEIGRTLKLRLVGQPNMSQFIKSGTFSVEFADDFPFFGYEYVAPTDNLGVWLKGYEIDGVDLSTYGVFVLDGTDASIIKSPDVKPRLTINRSIDNGATYDANGGVIFKSKEVEVKCLIKAPTIALFWKNYLALFWVLTRPEERDLYFAKYNENYTCYYKECVVTKFDRLLGGGVWCEFTTKLIFTAYRCGELEMILASELGEWILTEDEETIDIKPQ